MGSNRRTITPRMLTKEQAAEYCGISLAAFNSNIPVRPIALGPDARLLRYDVKMLDAWLDSCGPGETAAADDFWLRQAEKALS